IKYLDGFSRYEDEGSYNYVVFNDKHIEIRARYARNAAIWRSALTDAVIAIPTKLASADGWSQQIQSLIKNGKVKRDEVEWTGLSEWLAMHDGKIAKADIIDYLASNGVQVKEVVFGNADKF